MRSKYIRLTKRLDEMTKHEIEAALDDTDALLESLESRWKELEVADSFMFG